MTPGEWSVLAVDLDNGRELLSENPDRVLPTASVGKLFLLAQLAELIEADAAFAGRQVRRDAVEFVADSGIWQHLSVAELSVEDAARLVGTVSDNLATNVLLDLVGMEPVQQLARRLAPNGSMLHDRIRNGRGPEDPPTLSTGCAADWVGFFKDVHPRVLDWISASVDLSMVASAYGLDPLAHAEDDEIQVWNKTGSDPGTRADAGLVHVGGRRVAYAAICRYDPSDQLAVLARMRSLGESILST